MGGLSFIYAIFYFYCVAVFSSHKKVKNETDRCDQIAQIGFKLNFFFYFNAFN